MTVSIFKLQHWVFSVNRSKASTWQMTCLSNLVALSNGCSLAFVLYFFFSMKLLLMWLCYYPVLLCASGWDVSPVLSRNRSPSPVGFISFFRRISGKKTLLGFLRDWVYNNRYYISRRRMIEEDAADFRFVAFSHVSRILDNGRTLV